MNLLLIGAPGSGKGTLAEQLIDELNFVQVSTGDLLRVQIANKTELGIKAAEFMNAGYLVPDDLVNGMVDEFLQTQNDHLIFDGYPRTDVQAKAVDVMLNKYNKQIDKVIYLDVDYSVFIDRITGRMICPMCKASYHKTRRKPKVEWICDKDQTQLQVRPDDSIEKFKIRLAEYETQTAVLLELYADKVIRITNIAQASPSEVFNQVKGYLNND